MNTISLVGVGRMGANMARRLAERGFRITTVFDAHAPTAESLATELGCLRAKRLADVTASADAVVTVVTDDAAQRSVYLASSDNLLMGAAGKLFINCATVTPSVHV